MWTSNRQFPDNRTFFRLLLGDPKQSPGGVADGQRAHRTLLLKAPIGLRAPTTWRMPHEIPGVFHMLLRHRRGFDLCDLEEAAAGGGPQALESNSRVELDLPEGLLVV